MIKVVIFFVSIYNTLWYILLVLQKKVSTMAFTGIAATLLPNGKTIHRTFGLPVPLFNDSVSNIKLGSKEAKVLEETDLFIWDEAPMSLRYTLDIINRLLRDIMNNDLPFGGKIFILGGDFRQLLPVLIHGTRDKTISLSIEYSSLWEFFITFTLTENMRVLNDEIDFMKFLLDMGNGSLNDNNDDVKLPDCIIADTNEDIVHSTYGELRKKKEYKEISNCAILSARNIDVNKINNAVVNLFDRSTERIYTSLDSTENCNNNDDINTALTPEYLNSLAPASLPSSQLIIRKFIIVMLIRNLNIKEGLCNGTRLMILEFSNHLLKCEILTGDKAGQIIFLNRITLYSENEYPFVFKRRQFPIKLAFAITINKAQGQTFNRVSLDLRKDVFNRRQLYVALSRARAFKFVEVFLGNQRSEIGRAHV